VHPRPLGTTGLTVTRVGLGLAALFGVDPGICAGRVDQGEYRAIKFLGEFHYPKRLAIALGFWHPEVAVLALLCRSAFLVTDNYTGLFVKARKARYHRRVIPKTPIPVYLKEAGKQQFNEVERVRAVGMAGEFHPLPGVGRAGFSSQISGVELLKPAVKLIQRIIVVDRVFILLSLYHFNCWQLVFTEEVCLVPSSLRAACNSAR